MQRRRQTLVRRLGGAFDVVLSACLLSQMHLMLRRVLTDRHPLFEAIGMTLTVTHLRTVARLARPGARALFATDVASDEIAPLAGADPGVDGPASLTQLGPRRTLLVYALELLRAEGSNVE